jgi:hypothetical protein
MAYTDLTLLQMKFASLARSLELLDEKRRESIKAGRSEDADSYFLEYVSDLSSAEQLARELGYQDCDAAKADIKSVLAR